MPLNAKPPLPPSPHETKRTAPPELYQILIECRDEDQQRELYERLKREGIKVRVMVL
jgi:hypothetical protein